MTMEGGDTKLMSAVQDELHGAYSNKYLMSCEHPMRSVRFFDEVDQNLI